MKIFSIFGSCCGSGRGANAQRARAEQRYNEAQAQEINERVTEFIGEIKKHIEIKCGGGFELTGREVQSITTNAQQRCIEDLDLTIGVALRNLSPKRNAEMQKASEKIALENSLEVMLPQIGFTFGVVKREHRERGLEHLGVGNDERLAEMLIAGAVKASDLCFNKIKEVLESQSQGSLSPNLERLLKRLEADSLVASVYDGLIQDLETSGSVSQSGLDLREVLSNPDKKLNPVNQRIGLLKYVEQNWGSFQDSKPEDKLPEVMAVYFDGANESGNPNNPGLVSQIAQLFAEPPEAETPNNSWSVFRLLNF